MIDNYDGLKPGMAVMVRSPHMLDPAIRVPVHVREDSVYQGYVVPFVDGALGVEILEETHSGAFLLTLIPINRHSRDIAIIVDPTREDLGPEYRGYKSQRPDMRFRILPLPQDDKGVASIFGNAVYALSRLTSLPGQPDSAPRSPKP